MNNFRRIAGFILFMFVGLSCVSLKSYAHRQNELFERMPGPELLYPVTEDITIAGSNYLEFRWRKMQGLFIRRYEFRLYKGYNNFASDLIHKENFSVTDYPIKIDANNFSENQVYSWTLCAVLLDGDKSDISYSAFKVIKK